MYGQPQDFGYTNNPYGNEYPQGYTSQFQGQASQDPYLYQQQTASMYYPGHSQAGQPQNMYPDMGLVPQSGYYPNQMMPQLAPMVPPQVMPRPQQQGYSMGMPMMGMGMGMMDYGYPPMVGMEYGLPFAPFKPRLMPDRGPGVSGRWREEEHDLFLKGLNKYGRKWKKISLMVKTRTAVQIRTHAQKYFQSLKRHAQAAAKAAGQNDARILSEDDEKVSQITDEDNLSQEDDSEDEHDQKRQRCGDGSPREELRAEGEPALSEDVAEQEANRSTYSFTSCEASSVSGVDAKDFMPALPQIVEGVEKVVEESSLKVIVVENSEPPHPVETIAVA